MTEKIPINEQTRRYFEGVYGKELSDAQVLKYKNRLVKFFALLMEIDQRNKGKEAKNEN